VRGAEGGRTVKGGKKLISREIPKEEENRQGSRTILRGAPPGKTEEVPASKEGKNHGKRILK